MTKAVTPMLWEPSAPFEIQGHRGARGLRPENTLAGIACALEIGVASIECDVALSIDDAVVLSHDGAVPFPAPGAGPVTPVRQLALSDLRRLDVDEFARPAPDDAAVFRGEPGQRMATLGAALALLALYDASDVRLDIEIKSGRHTDASWDVRHVVSRVVAVIRSFGAVGTCSLRSFDTNVLLQAREQCPELARVLLVGTVTDRVPTELATPDDVTPQSLVELALSVGAVAVAPGRSLMSKELVDVAHSHALPVIPWTVNDGLGVRALMAMGVDGVCTDRPDIVRAALADDGVTLPRRHRAPGWLGYGWHAWPEVARPADAS
jgi:glycerophosphoryl diester phosphodiesterase